MEENKKNEQLCIENSECVGDEEGSVGNMVDISHSKENTKDKKGNSTMSLKLQEHSESEPKAVNTEKNSYFQDEQNNEDANKSSNDMFVDLIDINEPPEVVEIRALSKINGQDNNMDNLKKQSQEHITALTKEKQQIEAELMKLQQLFVSEKANKASEISKLKCILLVLKQEKFRLTSDIGSYQLEMVRWLEQVQQDMLQSLSALERQFQRDNREKKELLSEMTSMNEELNRRGETISSLKEVVLMYEKKVIELNNQQDCDMSTIKQLQDELTDRTQRLHELTNQQEVNSNFVSQLREELRNTSQRLQDLDSQQNVSNDTIKQLRDELEETTQRLVAANNYCCELESEIAKLRDHQVAGEGDHLSTSTVSRVEESARLRDLEESFEDRYCKLKVVAVKLKKRAAETQQTLDSERQKWTTERNELLNKLNQLTASARNNQTLQQELDRLSDALEAERMEVKLLRKATTDAKSSEVGLKVKLEEAQTSIEILKSNLDSAIRELDGTTKTLANKDIELETAVKEKLAEELIRKEKMKEVAVLEEKLKEEQDKLATMQKVVESAKKEARKQSVLSLEIHNYEKSLSDLSAQLTAEKSRVSSLEAEISTLQDIRDSLLEQIRLLEERVRTEENRCHQAQEEVIMARSSLRQYEECVASLEQRVGQLTTQLENERASAETATLELATLSSAVQTNTDIMLKEKQELSQQVTSLSSHVDSLTTQLETKEEELVAVRSEFDKYKVRAASVLRQHQSAVALQAETDARQELRAINETLREKLNESGKQIENLQSELATANREREAAEARCVNLNTALSNKSKLLEQAVTEHRSQKLNLETLAQCYKSQLEEKEKAMQEQIISLTEELEIVRHQLREVVGAAAESAVSVAHVTQPPSQSLPSGTEPPMLEREDGEGSEYIPEYSPSNTPPVSPKPMLPLDKLLESNDNLHSEREQLEVELATLRAQLEQSNKRALHQAALLADTEQDAARKEQLISVLKKEIGRLERCIQRQPHAQNTEYLKNIVFKFVTLETGEDRLRLVPVITTLLQLSPEETQSLTAIARGQSPEGVGGWSSYFSGWR